jgi:hypothetical protein
MAGKTVPTLAMKRVSFKELPKTLNNARAALGLSADSLARIALKLGALYADGTPASACKP